MPSTQQTKKTAQPSLVGLLVSSKIHLFLGNGRAALLFFKSLNSLFQNHAYPKVFD